MNVMRLCLIVDNCCLADDDVLLEHQLVITRAVFRCRGGRDPKEEEAQSPELLWEHGMGPLCEVSAYKH